LDITITADYGQGTVKEVNAFNSLTAFSQWGANSSDAAAAIWDQDRWEGEINRKEIKIPVQGVGRVFQVTIRHNSTDANEGKFRILSLALEASVMGK